MTAPGLAVFILARLDEIEADARACNDAPWDTMTWPGGTQIRVATHAHHLDPMKFRHMGHVATVEHEYDATHIARHDPARVLAEVAAKRAIVALHHQSEIPDARWGHIGRDPSCSAPSYPEESENCDTLLTLAALDSDHPDYDPGWKLWTP